MSRSARVLVVEDEPAIAESVAYALERDGFATEVAASCQRARELYENVELVVLDLMLPDGSGFDLITEMRKGAFRTPVIVLSSRDDEGDRVAALESGADDYVTKPFSPREIVARVRAVLRRTTALKTPTSALLSVNVETRRAQAQGRALELTRVEFDLLAGLLEQPGRVYTRDEIIERVWGKDFAISDRTVDSHVKSLRRKVTEAGADQKLIETVRGVGYRVTDEPSPEV